ncbi:MAG: hypothetical protein GX607_14610 [Myxococcales bacterium]|nr:hypothetical protein [Myxococcales bacterium]
MTLYYAHDTERHPEDAGGLVLTSKFQAPAGVWGERRGTVGLSQRFNRGHAFSVASEAFMGATNDAPIGSGLRTVIVALCWVRARVVRGGARVAAEVHPAIAVVVPGNATDVRGGIEVLRLAGVDESGELEIAAVITAVATNRGVSLRDGSIAPANDVCIVAITITVEITK